MEWLNLHTRVLDSPEVIGADPVERSTWLMLLRFAIGQETGGRIVACRDWKDRKWQQLVRVTKREVETISDLWVWDGNDLLVTYYPSEKEAEVKSKRLAGKLGGRPPKQTKQKPDGFQKDSQEETISTESSETERNRKGKERKEERERESARERFALLAQQVVAAYPRREKTTEALEIVLSNLLEGADYDAMISGTRACAAVIRTMPSGPLNRFVPSATEFFRSKRWADDPATLNRSGAKHSGQTTLDLDEARRQLGGRAANL